MNRAARFAAIASLLVCGVFALQGVSQAQVSNTWTSAGQMAQARTGAAAVLLTNGQILITGGADSTGVPQNTAEVYTPATQAFTAVAPMSVPRANHAAIVLASGDVLVTGGSTTGGSYSDSAEIFSASTQQWTLLNSSLGTGLAGQTMAMLSDGNVLIAGGASTSNVVSSVILYNWTTQTFAPVATLLTGRTGAVSAATQDGRVLIAGGTDINGAVLASTEIFVYSPTTAGGTISAGPTMSFPRMGATATTTYDGVAIIGGNNGKNDLGSAEIFSQWTNTFEVVTGGVPRSDHFAALLPNNGSILAMGGTGGTAVDMLEPWANSTAGAFFAVSPSLLNLDGGFASPAGPGSLLAAGGTGANASAAEFYSFPTISTDRAEYPPGTPVVMSGAGFQPSEQVALHMHEWVQQTTEDDPDATATTDLLGSFTYNGYAPTSKDVGARYHLTAVGLSSGYQAQVIFGDSITGISFTSTALDQPAGPANLNNNACGEITLSVTQTGGTYGNIYLYDGDLGNGTGSFYLTQGACTSNGSTITFIPSATVSSNPTDVTFWYENNTAGTDVIYADSSSGVPLVQCLLGNVCSNQTEFVYAAASKLSFQVQPGGGGPGLAWLQQPQVVVQDKNGNTVTSSVAPITLAITTAPAGAATGGTLAGCTAAVNAINGAATFSGCSITPANTSCYYLQATSSGLTSANSTCFYITDAASAPPSTVTASAPPVAANGTAAYTITVTLEDASDNLLGGKSVSLTAGSGNSIISGNGLGTSNGSGVATFTVTDTIAQTVTLTAVDTTDGVTIGSVTITFSAGAVSKTVSTVTASPTSVLANGTATSTITVTLTDSSGNPVAGKTVTLAQNGASVVSAASGPSTSAGVVTFTVTDATAQTVKYTATDSTDSLAITPTASVVFGSTAPALSFTTAPPSSAADGSAFPVAAATNNTPADTGAITYSVSGGCSIALVSGTETVTMNSGTASCVVTAKVAAETTPNAYATASISATVTATPATTGSQNVAVICTPGTFVYTGQPQTPCNATVTLVDGSTESLTVVYTPQNTNVGQVTATASFGGDSNNLPAMNSTTFQITQAPSTVTVSCPGNVEYVYNGAAQTPCTATVTGAGGLSQSVTPTYTNNVNAGTATANATYSDANHSAGNGSATFTIAPATSTLTLTCPSTEVYTGAAQTPCTASVAGAGGLNQSITPVYSNNTTVGTAEVTASYNGGTNGDYTVSSGSSSFNITQATSSVTINCPASVAYNGQPQTPCSAAAIGAGGLNQSLGVVYANNTNVGVNTATANATYNGDTNHTSSNGTQQTFTITVASITATAGSFNGVYNGTTGTISTCNVTGAYTGGLTCTNSVTSVGPGVGSGTVMPTIASNPNFSITTVNGAWSITPAPVTATAGSYTGVYNGNTATPSACVVTGAYKGTLVCTNNPTTVGPAVGTGSIAPVPSGDTLTNYTITLSNGSYNITGAASTTTVTCSPTSLVYTGATQTPCTATVTGPNGLNLSEPSTALSYTNNINVGTATATFTYAGNADDAGSMGSTTFAITPASTTVTVMCPSSVQYTGNAQTPCTASVAGVGTGVTQTVTFNYTNNTNVGTATVTATYGGDGNHAGTTSSPATSFTIAQAAALVQITCPVSAPYTGSAVTPCTAEALGLNNAVLNASLTVTYSNNVNVGDNTAAASASYSGNANYQGGGSTVNFSITQTSGLASTTTVTCSPTSVTYTGNAQSPCTATVTGSGGFSQSVPVTYTNNINAGMATANAAFAGNATYAGSSGSSTFTIGPAAVTVTAGSYTGVYNGLAATIPACTVSGGFTLNCTDNPASVGPAIGSGSVAPVISGSTSNFTVTPVNGAWAITIAPTTVTVTCPSSIEYTGSALTPCTATVTGAGGLSQPLTVTYTNNTSAGMATASASYAGTTTYAASNGSANFTITQTALTPTTTTVSCPSSIVATGSALTPCTATVTGAGGLNQPVTVTYTNNVGVGMATATASYAGSSTYASSNGSATFNITAAALTPTTTTVTCPTSVVANGSAQTPCSATVTGAGGLNQSVTVTYTNNVSAGTATASASYAGTSTYASSNGSATFTITLVPTTTAVTCPTSIPATGSPLTPCTATVTGAGGLNQSLTVSYLNNTDTGTATASASYAGTSTYAASTGSATFTITSGSGTVSPSVTTVTCPTTSVVYNASALTPCTAAVTGVGGLDQTLTVTYTSNVDAGTATANASFPGNANYMASSNSATFTIAKAGTTTSLTPSSSSVNAGQSVTLTAQVVSLTSGTPTGTVAFYDGTTLLGTQPLSAGTATLSTTSLNAGTSNTLNAVYGGDTNFTTSQSTTSVTVGALLDFTLSVTGPASVTVFPGGVATYTVVTNPLDGSYPGTVNFTATGLPTGSTASFSPLSIAANGGMQTITLTVTTPALAREETPSIGRKLAPLTLALLLFPLLGVGRLRRQGRRLSKITTLLLLLGCTLAGALMTGCSSSGSGFFAQAVQSYGINVTATSGSLQHTATVTLVVE